MNFHVLTLFPDMVERGLATSILGRAAKGSLIEIHGVDIREYTLDKHRKVDDYPYGGGAGMLMQAQPVYDAYKAVEDKILAAGRKSPRVIYLSPQGRTFSQKVAEELAGEEELVFLCGHYEGIDERVLEEIVTDEISIGDYVLTGGELAAMVMIDAIARLVPGVLNNTESAHTESFHKDLLEYPQYSRPEIWRGRKVPEVLLSGDHKKIEEWRLKQAVSRTERKRPDLYARYRKTQEIIAGLMKNKLIHMDMIELLRRGEADVLAEEEGGVLLKPKGTAIGMLSCADARAGRRILESIRGNGLSNIRSLVVHQEFLYPVLQEESCWKEGIVCRQAVYTRGVVLPVDKKVTIRRLTEDYLETVSNHYHLTDDPGYLRDRIRAGVLYGAFLQDTLTGFAGEHEEGSMGMLEVFPEYRRMGIAAALESFTINRLLAAGRTPFCQIIEGNEASIRLQEKLGLRISKDTLCWFSKNS